MYKISQQFSLAIKKSEKATLDPQSLDFGHKIEKWDRDRLRNLTMKMSKRGHIECANSAPRIMNKTSEF